MAMFTHYEWIGDNIDHRWKGLSQGEASESWANWARADARASLGELGYLGTSGCSR
jgi:hypothetical protein